MAMEKKIHVYTNVPKFDKNWWMFINDIMSFNTNKNTKVYKNLFND
jgi:hypothetical protein